MCCYSIYFEASFNGAGIFVFLSHKLKIVGNSSVHNSQQKKGKQNEATSMFVNRKMDM